MSHWFLVQTKPKQEIRASENLERQGINTFCPRVLVERLSRGKRRVSREVLFPNYLFVKFDQSASSAMSVSYTRGVNRIVSFGDSPTQVPEQLINQLQQRVDQNASSLISNLPEEGDQLQILDGPFRGLNAVFSQIDGDSRAVVLISILSQKVKAVLPFSSLTHSKKSNVRIL